MAGATSSFAPSNAIISNAFNAPPRRRQQFRNRPFHPSLVCPDYVSSPSIPPTFCSPSSTALHNYSPLGMAAAVTTSTYSTSFLKYAIAFIAGGLFFSSAIAAFTACYAVGMDNVKRVWAMFRYVMENIWVTFAMGLGAVKSTLVADGSWKWREAWALLKEKLQETRQKAVEGVEAIKREANLYAAAVGAPGLIPLQYALDRLMPFVITTALGDSFKKALAEVKVKQIKKLRLASFTAGTRAPKLEAARVFDLGDQAMAYDCDITWDSELEATVSVTIAGGLARVPITIKNVRFQGVVRIIFTPLIKSNPGFGATLLSLVNKPDIGLDVKVAGGELTRVPRLKKELLSAIQQNIADSVLWPKRTVVPSVGLLDKPVIARNLLKALEETDPLLQAEESLGARPMLRRKMENIMKGLQEDEGSVEEEFESVGPIPVPSFRDHHHNLTSTSVQNGVLWVNFAKMKPLIDHQVANFWNSHGMDRNIGHNGAADPLANFRTMIQGNLNSRNGMKEKKKYEHTTLV